MFDSWWGHGDYINGPLAQLARALPWHGRGQGFKSLMVHNPHFCSTWNKDTLKLILLFLSIKIWTKYLVEKSIKIWTKYLSNG
mgnify:FL=1